jgi:acyl dehydratase
MVPGERYVTQGRTVTETDLVMWSMFTGDLNPIHVDEQFAAAHSVFGTRVPQGLLAVAIASGLQERLGLWDGTGRAMLGQSIRFRRPLRIGDTIRVEMTVAEVRERDATTGHVRMDLDIIAAPREEVVVDGTLDVLVARRAPRTGPGK